MRERRRKHDDLHRPMQGKSKRATRPKSKAVAVSRRCPDCGDAIPPWPHLCRSMTVDGNRVVKRERLEHVSEDGASFRMISVEIDQQ